MSISHRTNRLKLVGTPAVEQLQNGRYQLTINCTTINSRNDWYSANKAKIFPDFGSLQSAQGSIDGLGARNGEAYADMRLVSLQSSTQGEKYIVTLVYATLGSEFVQVKDDTVGHTESGLRRVTRKSIAKAGTDFQKTVGTSAIDSQIDTESEIQCKLASYEIDDTDSYREVTEVYVQPGIISSVEDFEGSQKSFVQETFAQDPVTPSGFSKAREEISNAGGIPTNRFTFLEDNTVLSESEDKVGSQLAIVKEVFNGTPSTPTGGYSLADSQTSNVDGIPTKRFRFLKNNATLSESEDKIGSQQSIVKEVFNGEPATPSDYSIANEQKSNVDGIVTRRFTFLKDGVELSRSEDLVGSQLAIVKQIFNPANEPEPPTGYELASTQESDVDGVPTKSFTFLKTNIKLSESEDKVGSQLAIVQEWFKPNAEPSVTDYIIANVEESNLGGFPTERYTFLKNNAVLSESEDKVGSQLAIVKEIFGNDIADPTDTGYEIAKTEASNVDGIPTKRFTLLKTDIELSRSLDKVGSQEALVVEFFKRSSTSDPTESDYELAKSEKSNVGGFPTERFTFLKPDVTLSTSEDKLGSLEIFIEEIFAPVSDPSKTNFTEVKREESEVDGIKTRRVTFYKDDAIISRSFDAVGSQMSVVIRKFKSEPTAAEAAAFGEGQNYALARKEEEGKENVKIYNYTFLESNSELSKSEDFVGSQKAIVKEIFDPDEDPSIEEYSLARKEKSDVEGISTERFTFLKENVKLSESEDKVGSQLAIVQEWFSLPEGEDAELPTNEEGSETYVIAKVEESDVGGIPTKRYTFLLSNLKLSETEDNVGSQKAIIQEWFGIVEGAEVTIPDSTVPAEYIIAKEEKSNINGIPTERYTFLLSNVKLSESEDKVGSQLAKVEEWFGIPEGTDVAIPEAEEGETYVIANVQKSDIGGIPTERYTFLLSNLKLSETEDKVGSQKAIVQEWFGLPDETDPDVPTNDEGEGEYVIAKVDKSDVGGIPTARYTFLLENIKLSENEDNVGSQLAKVQEWFGIPDDAEVELPEAEGDSTYIIAKKEKSNIGGIPTERYTFLIENVKLSESEDKVGSQLAIVQEWFGIPDDADVTVPDHTGTGEYIIAKKEKSNIGGIPTERYTFLLSNIKLSETEDKIGSQKAIIQDWFGIPDDADVTLPDGEEGETYTTANIAKSDIGGIPTERYTFLLENIKLSETTDKVGSQLSIVQEWFALPEDQEPTPPVSDTEYTYVVANVQKSDVSGIPTERYTYLLSNLKLSETEDRVGSQLAKVEEWFGLTAGTEPDPPDAGEGEYIIAKVDKSNIEGIPTERYTFLLKGIKLSETEDKVGAQLAKVQDWFGLDEDPEEPTEDYVVANVERSDIGGIETERYTFLKKNIKLSETEDKVGSQLTKVQEWFHPDEEPSIEEYEIANIQKSNMDGIPTEKYTFLKTNIKLSETEDRVGSQKAKIEEWFNPEEDPSIEEYVIAKVEKSNIGGIPTEKYTFLKENVQLSRSEDEVGSQKAIVTEVFKPDEDPSEGDHVIAKKETSNVDGIPTERFTFLKPNTILLTKLDNRKGKEKDQFFLSQEVIQVFKPDGEPTPSNNGLLISKETRDEEGIPTEVFTFVHGEGEISNTESNADPALHASTRERTIVHLGEPTSEPEGVVISKKVEQQDGYEVHTIVSLEGDITGTTSEHEDYVEVEVPGEVEFVKEPVSSGGVSGDIAIVKVQPKRVIRKKVKIKVEIVKGLNDIPEAQDPAYDLGEISCSVTATNLQLSVGPGSTVTIGAGTNNIMSDTGFVQDFKVQTSITNYPGHFLITESKQETGSISYVSSSQPVASGNSISREEATSDRETKLIGTGSTKSSVASTFKETGELSRRVRPILVDFDGSQYYEVRTVTIGA